MSLFLIAHKLRGKPAFDIAEKMVCPVCKGDDAVHGPCENCENAGYWWILPTVGHRAYPYWSMPLENFMFNLSWNEVDLSFNGVTWECTADIPEPPEGLRDFYTIHDRQVKAAPPTGKPSQAALDLLRDLGL